MARPEAIEVRDAFEEKTLSNHSLIQYSIISRGENNV